MNRAITNIQKPRRLMDVWDTEIAPPPYERAKRRLRDDEAIVIEGDIIIADGYCGAHKDEQHPPYTLLFVIRNDYHSWVWVRGEPFQTQQPPGTAVLFSNRFQHGLKCEGCAHGPVGVWAAHYWELDKPIHRSVAMAYIRKRLGP